MTSCCRLFSLTMGQSRPLFVYLRLSYTTQIRYKLIKALTVCLGLEPRVAGWKTQMNPLSHDGTPIASLYHALALWC